MTFRVFVDGHEGTTGLRIHEYLGARADIELLVIDSDKRKDATERARLLNAADVAFLCLPDAAAKEAVALIDNPNTCVIDASTAHRTQAGWAFGLPELHAGQRDAIRASKRIANPGCHASSFILALRPLVDAGLVPSDARISCNSLTGYSGGGKKMIEQYQAGGDAKLDSPRPYALTLQHKHQPEMAAHTGLQNPPLFQPIVGNFYKGLAVSVPLHLADMRPGTTPELIHAALAARYANEPFIRVLPLRDAATLEDGFYDVQACNDTNRVDILVLGNERHAMVITRLDNLGKGASGAAVQSMNVHLGVEESLGLA
jgi:N-acetyl-gamma-glutamyl-phosphate reductase